MKPSERETITAAKCYGKKEKLQGKKTKKVKKTKKKVKKKKKKTHLRGFNFRNLIAFAKLLVHLVDVHVLQLITRRGGKSKAERVKALVLLHLQKLSV